MNYLLRFLAVQIIHQPFRLFDEGIHAMEENVWNCLEYNYTIENDGNNFDTTFNNNPRLLRIQNSSYLKKKHLDTIIIAIKKANELTK